jgi:S-adenosylmethionine decarboxylase
MKIKQLLIDAHGCKCDLNDAEDLLPAFRDAVNAIGATIVKEVVYKYEPQGITIVLLLAESHASIYTWPELDYAAIEIFLCNDKMDPHKFWEILEKSIKPERADIKEMMRNVSK